MPKSEKQKLKIFYIADYLMRKTDANGDEEKPNGVYLWQIRDYLKKKGIDAEEHSIRRDIDLLGDILDIQGGKGKPVYVAARMFPFDDVKTIAECVASANFISRPEAEELIDELKILCSEHQEKQLKSDYIVAERPKYTRKRMITDLETIKDVIKKNKKISFIYTRTNPDDFTKTENRRKGERYVVSPFKVVLSDGHHYLIVCCKYQPPNNPANKPDRK